MTVRYVGLFIRWCGMLSFLSDGAVCRAFHLMVWNVEFFCLTVRYVGLFIRWCGMLSFLSDGAVCRAFHPMVWNVKFFVRLCGM